jgi:uroporphyrinogen-III synthase
MQVNHLFQVAVEMNQAESMRSALSRMVIASIGPTTSERLGEFGFTVDVVPTHPRMGYLVIETAQQCAEILKKKRIASE